MSRVSTTEMLQPHIRSLKMYEGLDPTEELAKKAGVPSDQVIRLNGNENPYGPSPKVADALSSFGNYNHYPDPEQRGLRDLLSDYLGVGAEHIVAGNGSDEIIDLILRMFLAPGEKIIDPAPTFGMYSLCARINGGGVVTVPRDSAFEIDVDAVRSAVDGETKAIFFASPNNPTGNVASEAQVRRIAETGIIVVVDETYHEFSGHTVLPLLNEYPNLIVLRTFSKWAGLAGLRIGLGVMHPDVARVMMAVKPPYNVNTAAELALKVSLEDRSSLAKRVKAIVAERERMFSLLEQMPGVLPWASQANFIWCRFPQGKGKETYEALCRKGIFVRHFSGPGLEDYTRISVGLPHQTDALISALEQILNSSRKEQ